VVVGNYRAAPAEDCKYLLDRLVDWLNGPTFVHADPEIQFALILAKAVYAHLYLAWIHPFGDGNGRTARLLEFVILASSGLVPFPQPTFCRITTTSLAIVTIVNLLWPASVARARLAF
jgi:Fic family protein